MTEENIINKQFLVVFTGLFCGTISILLGGFGNENLDKVLHLIIFVTVLFVAFYLFNLNIKKYLIKAIILLLFFLVYSILFNPYLTLIGLIILTLIFLIPNRRNIPLPDISKDSPLSFGFRNIGILRILLCLIYAVFLFVLH